MTAKKLDVISSNRDISMNPGADEAVARGCTCPQMDNCRGQGRYGSGEFWIHKGCPLHDKQAAQ